MTEENRFQFAKSEVVDEIILLNASMKDFAYGKHAHEEFSFGVTLAGRQDFFSLGEFHKSHPGNVITLNPGDVHDGHSGGETTLHYKMLYVHPDQLLPMLKSVGLKQAEDYRVRDTVAQDPVLQRHILNLYHLVETADTSNLAYSSALYEFARYLALKEGVESERSPRRKDPMLERVRDYLHAHVHEEVSLDELSSVVPMSKYHLLRCFRDYFGLTPHQYWLNYRINCVRRALGQGMSLADVVFAYGFNDLSHLNRRFKPAFGMTPHQFQREILRL